MASRCLLVLFLFSCEVFSCKICHSANSLYICYHQNAQTYIQFHERFECFLQFLNKHRKTTSLDTTVKICQGHGGPYFITYIIKRDLSHANFVSSSNTMIFQKTIKPTIAVSVNFFCFHIHKIFHYIIVSYLIMFLLSCILHTLG